MKKLFVSKKFILTTLLTALAGFLTFRFIGYYRGKNGNFLKFMLGKAPFTRKSFI